MCTPHRSNPPRTNPPRACQIIGCSRFLGKKKKKRERKSRRQIFFPLHAYAVNVFLGSGSLFQEKKRAASCCTGVERDASAAAWTRRVSVGGKRKEKKEMKSGWLVACSAVFTACTNAHIAACTNGREVHIFLGKKNLPHAKACFACPHANGWQLTFFFSAVINIYLFIIFLLLCFLPNVHYKNEFLMNLFSIFKCNLILYALFIFVSC
jgi:hypothetical protein